MYNDIKQQANILMRAFGPVVLTGINWNLKPPALPDGADSYFLIPSWRKIGKSYAKATNNAINALAKSRGGKFKNWLDGKVDDAHLRQIAPRDVSGVAAAQLGTKYRGKSVGEVREKVSEKEISKCCGSRGVSSGVPFDGSNVVDTRMCENCGDVFIPNQPSEHKETLLGAYEVAVILLTNPDINYENEWWGIDCAGDEFSPGGDGVFSEAPSFNFDDGLRFFAKVVSFVYDVFGSASGFVPQSNLDARPLGTSDPSTLESALRAVKAGGYVIYRRV